MYSIAWFPDGNSFASASGDRTIKLWDVNVGYCTRTLEGHTSAVSALSFSFDGHLLASQSSAHDYYSEESLKRLSAPRSNDPYDIPDLEPLTMLHASSIHLWRTGTWELVSTFSSSSQEELSTTLAFHPTETILATLGDNEGLISLWNLDIQTILSAASTMFPVSYTNAKVVLLGDSGVGKSGLGLVLSGQAFELTPSTHGRHIWTFNHQEVNLDSRRKESRETLLWDLAGQPGYRLIHQLYLNEVTLALVVFDAHSETDPFSGVLHWNRALSQAQRVQGASALSLKKFLVVARIDRGGIGVSPKRIKKIVDELGFEGYFETSAKEGWGISKLRDAINETINWETLPKVSSTELFQQIMSFLVTEKEKGRLLSTLDDLYRAFIKSKDGPTKTADFLAEFDTCIGRVESAGLIKQLSFGKLVLLQPELLDTYASALVNTVKDEPDGLGSIGEVQVRSGDFRMPSDERLKDKEQEKLLLIAMVEDLLRRELVLREEAFLVFPSQSTREKPDMPDPEDKAVIFEFEGPILNIYATLAVRLANCGLFKKKEIWKNAITYTATVGGVCGMFLRNIGEGRGELILFFDSRESATEQTRFHFEEYVRIHLHRRAIPETIKRRRIFVCSGCGWIVTNQTIQLLAKRGSNKFDCPVCKKRIKLVDKEEHFATVASTKVQEMDRIADNRRDIQVNKTSVDGKKETQDFDVFLCHHSVDKPAVKLIGEQLKEMGLLPWLDEWELRPGFPWQSSLEEQIEKIKAAAVFVGKSRIGPWQDLELSVFLRQFIKRRCPVIPVILADCKKTPKLPIFLEGMAWVDFRRLEPDPLQRLVWGITGNRNSNSKVSDNS